MSLFSRLPLRPVCTHRIWLAQATTTRFPARLTLAEVNVPREWAYMLQLAAPPSPTASIAIGMTTTQDLLGLPVEVFRLILDRVIPHHPASPRTNRYQSETGDINTFRLVSRACNSVSEPIFFRKIILHDRTPSAEDHNERICERIRSVEDPLSKYVRHVQIGPFKQDAHCPNPEALTEVLLYLENLQEFS